MKRRLKVLVLTSTFPRWQGDACPMFVADLCRGLGERMDVTVLAPGAASALKQEQWDNFEVRRFRYGWPDSTQRLAAGAIMPNIRRNPILMAQVPPFFAAQLYAAWRLMRSEQYDAIHAHWAVPQGIVASILKRMFKVPVITTTHGGDIYALRGGPAMRAKRWALNSSDRITAVSNALRDEVIALGPTEERVSVLPMGVDTHRFLPDAGSLRVRQELNPSGGPIILFVGRLVEKKGARYAVQAMPAVLELLPDARLVMAGDGPEQAMLEALSRELRVEDSVTFMGAVVNKRLPEIYASADVFVGPSVVEENGDREGVPVALGEAMASGCAVIATNAGGIADLVEDDATGLLVAERDPAALATAVTSILSDVGLRSRLREAALASVRARFDHQIIHAAYADVIEEAVAA